MLHSIAFSMLLRTLGLLLAILLVASALTQPQKDEILRKKTALRAKGIDETYYEWDAGHKLTAKKWKVDSTMEKYANPKKWEMYSKVGNATNNNVYYMSQLGQDELVALLTDYKQDGFFVDLAANDWKYLSNTLALERYFNWGGICIEPLPAYQLEIMENRRCKLVINPVYSKSGHTVKFHVQHVFSGIVDEEMDNTHAEGRDLALNTVTLQVILDSLEAPAVMDFMSLDVEGAELHVLHGLDMTKYTFLIMSVERPSPHVHKVLTRHGYHFLLSLPLLSTPLPHTGRIYEETQAFGEVLYIHKTHPKFAQHMDNYRISTYAYRTAMNGKNELGAKSGMIKGPDIMRNGKLHRQTVMTPWLLEPAWPVVQDDITRQIERR